MYDLDLFFYAYFMHKNNIAKKFYCFLIKIIFFLFNIKKLLSYLIEYLLYKVNIVCFVSLNQDIV